MSDDTDAGSNLPMILGLIEQHDTDDDARYPLVLWAVSTAADEGLQAGFRLDPREPEWPVAYITLPQGQVSWHIPAYPEEWDGHTTEEKYRRCREFAASVEGQRRS